VKQKEALQPKGWTVIEELRGEAPTAEWWADALAYFRSKYGLRPAPKKRAKRKAGARG
jgi:hypothetical protein